MNFRVEQRPQEKQDNNQNNFNLLRSYSRSRPKIAPTTSRENDFSIIYVYINQLFSSTCLTLSSVNSLSHTHALTFTKNKGPEALQR